MNYIIFDLEATCWRDRNNGKKNEIIEIGALKIDETGQIIDSFEAFIKPVGNPILSEFCTELTTITQDQVDQAPEFPQVIQQFKDWIGVGREDYLLCSWGFYDKKQIRSDCEMHGLEYRWAFQHISVKHQHGKLRELQKPLGLGQAIDLEEMTFTGTAHRGIDDARNIAKIFIRYLGKWKIK